MEILVASFNSHKIAELEPMFTGCRLLSPAQVGIEEFEIEEDGESYFANALIKAKAIYALRGLPTLADDSGLSVHALGGAPGIHSSRYGSSEAGRILTAGEKNALLVEIMKGQMERKCAFYCCLVLYLGQDRYIAAQETCPGILLDAPRGSGGFGYDPLVYLPEFSRSVAELSAQEKNLVSHRGKAARTMNAMIASLASTFQ
jgi:XTP/dITP diphosphohydrolase